MGVLFRASCCGVLSGQLVDMFCSVFFPDAVAPFGAATRHFVPNVVAPLVEGGANAEFTVWEGTEPMPNSMCVRGRDACRISRVKGPGLGAAPAFWDRFWVVFGSRFIGAEFAAEFLAEFAVAPPKPIKQMVLDPKIIRQKNRQQIRH